MENAERTVTLTAEYEQQEQLDTILFFLHTILTEYRTEHKDGINRAYITVCA